MRSRLILAMATTAMVLSSLLVLAPIGRMSMIEAAGLPLNSTVTVQGTLVSAPAALTAPVTLMVQTTQYGLVDVNVSASTSIVRLYGGRSGLDELSANDTVRVTGVATNGQSVTATNMKDLSIQAAYTRLVGQVTAVSTSAVVVTVQKDQTGQAPFALGQSLSLPVVATTKVTAGSTTVAGTTSQVKVGATVAALGVFNRNTNSFVSVARIRVLQNVVVLQKYHGYLVAAPTSLALPTTLLIHTINNGVVTVSVTSATQFVRLFGAVSSLDELSANDIMEVVGQITGPNTVTASRVRDMSIQAAYTRLVGQVTAVTASSVSVVVQNDAIGHAPFSLGQNLTLPVGTTTKVISSATTVTGTTTSLTVGARITALGVFNRTSQTFKSIFRIRIM